MSQTRGLPSLWAQRWWLLPTVAFVLVRTWLVLVPLGHLYYRGGTIVMNDVSLYAQWARGLQNGQYPVGDEMWQYPPLAGPAFALGAWLPPDPESGLMVLMLAADAAIFALLLWASRRSQRTVAAWSWVAAGALIGPVMLTRFDLIPAVFAVLGLLSLAHPGRAGAALAAGALLKVWPGLLLLAVPRTTLRPTVLWFAAVFAGVLLVLGLWSEDMTSFIGEQRSRGLQAESVGAWIIMLAAAVGVPHFYRYQYGAMEIISDWVGPLAAASTLLTVAGLAWIVWLRWRGRLEHALPADVGLVVILISMVTSRVLSPQYLIWVAAISAVCLLDPATVMRPVIVLLAAAAALGQIIYPMQYDLLLEDTWQGLALQSSRLLLLLIATGWGLWLISVSPRSAQVGVPAGEQVGQSG